MKQDFDYKVDRFGDFEILRYEVSGFDDLTLREKKLIYYLAQAGYYGRDIIYDQHYRYNLLIRHTLEAVFEQYSGDRECEDFGYFVEFLKTFWFNNGLHNEHSAVKNIPKFDDKYFEHLIFNTPEQYLPLHSGLQREELITTLIPVLFDKKIDFRRISLDPDRDLLLNSAVNFYENITQPEAEAFYKKLNKEKNKEGKLSIGLHSKLVKQDGKIVEKIYKKDGLYTHAINKIVFWLKKAYEVALNEKQKQWIKYLIVFYETGDLQSFNNYNIAWVGETDAHVDAINGFIENYSDPLGMKATFESIVSFVDKKATDKIRKMSEQTAWFENELPINPDYKRKNPQGVSYRIIQLVAEAGDSSPATPIGVNLPNPEWIREEYGSKSISLRNIEKAYFEVSKESGMIEEFYLPEYHEIQKNFGLEAALISTGLHEVIGHGSGKLAKGVGNPADTLKNYANTLEETRADLVALYFCAHPRLREWGLISAEKVMEAEYNSYIQNGLMTQLTRIKPDAQIEQAHMRNRQLIAAWAYEKGKKDVVIEKVVRKGKTYFRINDYQALHQLWSRLLTEVQRIKSEGDYEAARDLIETYGVNVDPEIHREALMRFKKLDIAPFKGFLNPYLRPVVEKKQIVDVKIEYAKDFATQMLEYSKKYTTLPF